MIAPYNHQSTTATQVRWRLVGVQIHPMRPCCPMLVLGSSSSSPPPPKKKITFSFVAKQACFAQKKGGKNNNVSNHNHTQGPKAEHTPSLNTSAELFVSFSPSFLFLSVGKEKNNNRVNVKRTRRKDKSEEEEDAIFPRGEPNMQDHARHTETETHTKREIREGGEEFHHAKQASSRARARARGWRRSAAAPPPNSPPACLTRL